MKFISKNSNLRVILSPSIQAEPLAGRAAIRGLFVKFEDGVANVVDDQIIDMMLKHPAYNVDFICAEEGAKDPYLRRSVEPEHNVVNIEYGHVGKNVNPATALTGLTPELKKVLSDMAVGMAQKMTEEALKEFKAQILEGMKRGATPESAPAVETDTPPTGTGIAPQIANAIPEYPAPKRMGRPPKIKS